MEEQQLKAVIVDSDVANLQLPDPSLANYWKLLKNRTFFVDYDIDECLIELEKNVMLINVEDFGVPIEERKPIRVFIYSYGGDLSAVYSCIDVFKNSITPVHTINIGVAMSAGLLLLLAGSKRYCMPMSQALIHSGSGGFGGTFEQTKEAMENYKKQVEIMKNYIIERTGMDVKIFNKNKTKDWYIDSEQQLALGIVHNIIGKDCDFNEIIM